MLQSTISLQQKPTPKLTVKKPTNFGLPHHFEGRETKEDNGCKKSTMKPTNE